MSESDTRSRLLESGIRLFREQGYHGTGVQQISHLAGIPKGSFCYFFKSKEDFASAVIARYADRSADLILAYATRQDTSPVNRLISFFVETATLCEQEDCRHGCTIGNLLAEIGDTNERLRQNLESAWQKMADALAQLVSDAQKADQIASDNEPDVLAQHLLSSWEGALISMRAQRSVRPLHQFIQLSLTPLLRQSL